MSDENAGVEVEKWILRSLLLVAVGLLTAGILSSLDDMKRYWRMRQM